MQAPKLRAGAQAAASSGSRRAAAGFVEGFAQIGSRDVPGRRESKQQTCQQRNAERKRKNQRIEVHLVHARSIRRNKRSKRIDSPVGERKPEHAAGKPGSGFR